MSAQVERRTLRMHPRLLWDVIHRQAGELSKSVLEGVMNSIDAAGTRCDVTLTNRKLVIDDDGKGFSDRNEIESFFETFGYPHEEGDATYGRFRMGRGQLFAVGANSWKSNRFEMSVDLKGQGESKAADFELGYGLSEVPAGDAYRGCRIEVDLYEPMNEYMLSRTSRSIAESVAWAQVPVTLNGKSVSRRPQDAQWDLETDDAYIKFSKTGNMSLYNLGVLVCNMPSSRFGTGGIVVSKKKLDVNFARNAVQGSCPVWKRILKHVDKSVSRDVAKTQKLDDAGRERLARGIMDGEMDLLPLLKQRLVTDVTGSHRRLADFVPSGYGLVPLTVAPTGDRVGDKVMQQRLALVISADTLSRFGVPSAEKLVKRLKEVAARDLVSRSIAPERHAYESRNDPVRLFLDGLGRFRFVSMDMFRKTFTENHDAIPDASLKRGERIAIEALNTSCERVRREMLAWCRSHSLPTPSYRRVYAGASDTAAGWTDGMNNIWIERNQLPNIKTPAGRVQLAGLLLHELMHREPDTDTHVHGVEFYQMFHDMALHTGVLEHGAATLAQAWANRSLKADKKAGVDEAAVLTDLDGDFKEGVREEAAAPGMG